MISMKKRKPTLFIENACDLFELYYRLQTAAENWLVVNKDQYLTNTR